MTTPAETLREELVASGSPYLVEDIATKDIKFFEELVDYGIESLQQFEDSYQGQFSSEGDFVEHLLDEGEPLNIPSWVCIDYQLSWDSALRHDFFSINTGYDRYEIFSQYF